MYTVSFLIKFSCVAPFKYLNDKKFIDLSFSEFVSDTLSEIEKDEEIGPSLKGRCKFTNSFSMAR